MVLASRACAACGLCWPGTKNLVLECGLGETRLRDSLADLESAGLVAVRAYRKGGRGRATEYVVLPNHVELSTAPCEKCLANMRKGSPREGFDNPGTDKPLATRGVSTKPLGNGPLNPSPREPQLQLQPNPHARARDMERPPAGAASDPTPPRNAQEALAAVKAMTGRIGGPDTPDRS